MTGTRKSGKEDRAKGAGKKKAAGVRPAKSASPTRAKTADTLKESAEKYRFLIDATNTGYVILDDRGRVLDANREYVRMTGRGKLEDILGKPVTDWTASYDLERNAAEVRKCMETGSVCNLMVDYVDTKGKTVPVEIHATVLPGPPAARIFTVCRDITERKRAEQAQRESEARARSIVRSIPMGMHLYRLEPDGRLVFIGANPAADDILGVDNSIFFGKTIEEAFPPLKDTEVPERYRDVVRSGKSWQTESIEYQDSGIKGAFEVHAFQTAPDTMAAAFEDITARKRSESALRQGEEKYRRLYNETPVLLHSIDRKGLVVEVNDHWLKTLGYERGEVVGRKVTDFFTDDSKKYAQEVVQPGFFRDGMVKDVSYQFVKKNGEVVDVLLSATAERDAAGNVVRSQAVIQDVSERKHAGEALRASEERFRVLSDAAFEAIAMTEKGIFLDANRQMCDMLGYTLDELKGMPVENIIAPEDRELVRRNQSSGYEPPYENRLLRRDGTVVLVESRARHFMLQNRKVRVTVLRDITERKQTEAALRKSEKMLQTIIDAEPECVKLLDENANLIMMNRAGLDMLEVGSLDLVKGQCVCPLVTSEYRQSFLDLVKEVFQGGSGTLMFEMVGMKGRHLWMETHAVPMRNEKDEITAFLGVTRDVTERKLAEDALRENQARLDLALQSAHMGVWRWEIREDRRYFDALTCQLLGIDRNSFTGSAEEFLRAIHPEDREKVKAALARTLAQDIPYEPAYRIVWPDGTVRHITARGRLIRDDKGQPERIHGILWDITDQHLFEQELLKTQKLESIGTLAGGIAHDFNNLLQGIFGYISMAKLKINEREKSLAMLEQAEMALHQSVSLASQLLTFSKGGKPVKKVLELRPVIENACAFSLSGSRTGCRIKADEGLWCVDADEGQLGQVVQNIVLNADQAMPGGGTIELAARNVPAGDAALPQGLEPGNYVAIAISDSGVGIPVEYQSKIFDPYFTTKEKGSGLGLATSYSIIRNHGGLIRVGSVPGAGTTFTVYLPASAKKAAKVQARSAPAPGRTGRVLVMDDDDVVRTVAGELLRTLGHEVVLAVHGEEAIEKYRQAMAAGRPFDVIILDLTIRGGMGGAEAVRKLLEIDPGVKAVVSSGYSDDAVTSNYREHGFHAYLRKPYTAAGLSDMLSALIS